MPHAQPNARQASLARLAWRYRSELAPAYLAVGLLAAAVLVRWRWPWAWPAVALTGLLAAGGLWAAGRWVGLDRAAERAYAAVIALTGGAWAAAAAWHGPLRPSLLGALAAGTILLGLPWWAHRRRRTKVRLVRTVKQWAEHAQHAGLAGSRLQRVDVDPAGGWTARLLLRPGQTLEDVLPNVRKLESALDLRPRAIEAEEDPTRARRVILRVAERDPLARPLPWPGPPGDASLAVPWTLGAYQDGSPCQAPLAGQHVLIAGQMGSGKSVVLHGLIGHLAASPDIVLWGCDLKGGAELGLWRGVFDPDRLATRPPDAVRVLEAAVAVCRARAAHMGRVGWQTWPASPERPALIVVVDEYARLPREAHPLVEELTETGRAPRVQLASATQYPTVQALGSSRVAQQFSVKVCLRVANATAVNVVFGPGAVKEGWRAHKIPKTLQGGLYLHAPGAEAPRLARAFHATEPAIRRLAAQLADHQPRLDAASAAGLPPAAGPAATPPVGGPAPQPPGPPPTSPASLDPSGVLVELLFAAGPAGLAASELVARMEQASGLSRASVYNLLRSLREHGLVVQAGWGRWRLAALPPKEPRP